ncbi:hypothetical protein [Maritalea mediterranea]|uniref:Uncharacterized protein n=1 Tax=Maritalea mediterranea TaxID=2909667 RepID=A0ABS9E956_9HYPH|nr:hypothetical protein [Maritalea mediterranea]MCF4099396.1 hypothetical protein [Maritalea mediterranea]
MQQKYARIINRIEHHCNQRRPATIMPYALTSIWRLMATLPLKGLIMRAKADRLPLSAKLHDHVGPKDFWIASALTWGKKAAD